MARNSFGLVPSCSLDMVLPLSLSLADLPGQVCWLGKESKLEGIAHPNRADRGNRSGCPRSGRNWASPGCERGSSCPRHGRNYPQSWEQYQSLKKLNIDHRQSIDEDFDDFQAMGLDAIRIHVSPLSSHRSSQTPTPSAIVPPMTSRFI